MGAEFAGRAAQGGMPAAGVPLREDITTSRGRPAAAGRRLLAGAVAVDGRGPAGEAPAAAVGGGVVPRDGAAEREAQHARRERGREAFERRMRETFECA